MVENNQALEAYKVWLNASEKYDYHIAGIAGALTAWGVDASVESVGLDRRC